MKNRVGERKMEQQRARNGAAREQNEDKNRERVLAFIYQGDVHGVNV